MDDDLLKAVTRYRKGHLTRRELLAWFNPIILGIPGLYRCFNEDIKHDFYAKIISRIDKILEGYRNTGNASFKTWFIIVLKRSFITFVRLKGNKERKYKELESYYNYKIFFDAQNNYPFDDDNNKTVPGKDLLSHNEKKVLSYKYGFQLIDEDIGDAVEIILSKIEKKKRLELRLERKYLKGLLLEKKIMDESNDFAREKLILKNELNKKYKKKLEEEYRNFKILPSNKWVGSRLGLHEGTIASYLSRIKYKLNNNIKKASGL